jgi:hypothetical protein
VSKDLAFTLESDWILLRISPATSVAADKQNAWLTLQLQPGEFYFLNMHPTNQIYQLLKVKGSSFNLFESGVYLTNN